MTEHLADGDRAFLPGVVRREKLGRRIIEAEQTIVHKRHDDDGAEQLAGRGDDAQGARLVRSRVKLVEFPAVLEHEQRSIGNAVLRERVGERLRDRAEVKNAIGLGREREHGLRPSQCYHAAQQHPKAEPPAN